MAYFRITAYHPDKDISVILDSNGRFEKLWEFSAYLVAHGFKIIEVGKEEALQKVNIEPLDTTSNKIYLRSIATGKPETRQVESHGNKYVAILVGKKAYGQIVY